MDVKGLAEKRLKTSIRASVLDPNDVYIVNLFSHYTLHVSFMFLCLDEDDDYDQFTSAPALASSTVHQLGVTNSVEKDESSENSKTAEMYTPPDTLHSQNSLEIHTAPDAPETRTPLPSSQISNEKNASLKAATQQGTTLK